MAVVLNPHYIYVNSNNRLDGNNGSFSYNINLPTDKKFTHVTLVDALIPKSYYLIQDGYNTFQMQEGVTIVTVSIPIGCYTLQTFMGQLNILLSASSPNGWTYTVTYPSLGSTYLPDTGKLTYTVSGNTSQPSFIFNAHCVVYEQLGFAQNSTNTFVNNTLVSSNVIKLQSEDRILLHSNCVNNPENDDVLCSINATSYLNYSSINYTNPSPVETARELKSSTINTVSFQLTDENNDLLFVNGLNTNYTLMFFQLGDFYTLMKDYIRLTLHSEK
jgi:hypothetical protein